MSDLSWFQLILAITWILFILVTYSQTILKTDSADFFFKILTDFPWNYSALYRTLLLKGRLEFQALWAFSLVSSLLPYFTKFMQKNPPLPLLSPQVSFLPKKIVDPKTKWTFCSYHHLVICNSKSLKNILHCDTT